MILLFMTVVHFRRKFVCLSKHRPGLPRPSQTPSFFDNAYDVHGCFTGHQSSTTVIAKANIDLRTKSELRNKYIDRDGLFASAK